MRGCKEGFTEVGGDCWLNFVFRTESFALANVVFGLVVLPQRPPLLSLMVLVYSAGTLHIGHAHLCRGLLRPRVSVGIAPHCFSTLFIF